MRELLLDTLTPTRYRRFFLYVMGPYKSHTGPDEEMFEFLVDIRNDLRDGGFNAFLATDAEIPLAEMDAGTQSLEFARVSNVVVFIAPLAGMNLGVGIETGAVLEDMGERATDRILFVHEVGVRSAMIRSVADRWDATVHTYENSEELVDRVSLFARDVMRKETTGKLPSPPEP